MPIQTKAAIAPGYNEKLIIEEVELRDPGPGEVLIEMKASGLCHSDLTIIEGKFPFHLPAILGHEGAGIVAACAEGITRVRPGDRVILNNLPHCGICRPCRSGKTSFCADIPVVNGGPSCFSWKGAPLPSFGRVASFAAHTVVREDQLSVITENLSFASAALVSCGVVTGIGAALNDAKVEADSSVVVFGMGSIGLNVVQAARLAKAGRIIAVDANPAKEAIARQFGATDFVVPASLAGTLAEDITARLGGFADYAFDCVGSTALIAEAVNLVSPYWGVAMAVGIPPFTKEISLPATSFYFGRTLRGTMIGDGNPITETPKIIDWYTRGEVLLDELVSHRLPLEQINEGFDLMRRGECVRVTIAF